MDPEQIQLAQPPLPQTYKFKISLEGEMTIPPFFAEAIWKVCPGERNLWLGDYVKLLISGEMVFGSRRIPWGAVSKCTGIIEEKENV